MATIKVGAETFSADREFTVVAIDDSNRPIACGFGKLPMTRLLWITFRQGGAFLNADLADNDGETVLQIRENVITQNTGSIYTILQIPENQIPPDRILVIDQDAEVTMVLRRDGDIWDFNGDFYYREWHIVAAPNGITIDPVFQQS